MRCRHLKSALQRRPKQNVARLSTRLVLASVATGFLALSAGAAPQQTFGRLFPDLPPYNAPDDATLDLLTAETASDAPGPMLDSGNASDNNPDDVPAFFTYFGQFLDHDMTLDSLPLPADFVDPTTIPNDRDQRLNLDSVYGTRKNPNPALYEADGKHLKVNGGDLPRTAQGIAIIGDPRNDENQIIAQIHVAYLRAHNKLIDEGLSFADARQLMEWRHQWIVVHEFLPEVLDPDVYNDVFRANKNQDHIVQIHNRYYDPGSAATADMPVEFSVGAYRFGHSQVRAAYRIVQNPPPPAPSAPFIQVFKLNPTAPDDLQGDGRSRLTTSSSGRISSMWTGCQRPEGCLPPGSPDPSISAARSTRSCRIASSTCRSRARRQTARPFSQSATSSERESTGCRVDRLSRSV